MLKVPTDQILESDNTYQWAYPFHRISQGSGDAALIQARPSIVTGIMAFNKGAATVYLKLYNSSLAPLVGSTPVQKTIPLPPSQLVSIDKAFVPVFDKGLGMGLVTGLLDTDATGVTAGDVTVDIDFR
jgi:hypothetical protein